jgi:hypothetical protein
MQAVPMQGLGGLPGGGAGAMGMPGMSGVVGVGGMGPMGAGALQPPTMAAAAAGMASVAGGGAPGVAGVTADGQPSLRFPDPLQPTPEMPPERAAEMLARAAQLATEKPFVWAYIDKPGEHTVHLVFLPRENSVYNDGIRYLDRETRMVVPLGMERVRIVITVFYAYGTVD